MTVNIRDVGDSAVVAELEAVIDPAVNAHAIGIGAGLRAQRVRGVRDVVSTFHSVGVHFDPLATDGATIGAALRRADQQAPPPSKGPTIEVPVAYGGAFGPDLEAVAAFARCSPGEVVERHTSRRYRVYMLGFLPGYPYMGTVDEAIAAPRLATPRMRVPAGSVGIAGRQTGIYPRESPGGWQIIGRTSARVFDPDADPPALFAPGDEVQFVPVPAVDGVAPGARGTTARSEANAAYDHAARVMTVLSPGLHTTIQDEGRWGYQHLGVPVAGPMDTLAHRLANAVLGNPAGAATLEATLTGPELRVEHDAWLALAGADLQPSLDGRDAPMGVPVKWGAGTVLRFGARRAGARVYIAVDGGVDVPRVLGSRATHVLSGLGGIEGRALRAGDRLPLGRPSAAPARARADVHCLDHVEHGGGVRLRVLPGPQLAHVGPSAFEVLQQGRYTVSPQSDRMGYRLRGARVPSSVDEMISSAVFIGGLQVPPSGEPILLMADRQTTGGYPQIAVVIAADLPRAAQLAPGDWVEFEACSQSDARAALRAQEGLLGAIG